ncbi:MAG: hypothetical protein IJQ81_06460 [Oscillibacter sp.]|nr:hypothetical protein [Oscillibacter sp.]
MKFKKLASLLIAGAMVFSMAMPAFALTTLGETTQAGGSANASASAGSNQPSDLARSLQFTGTTNVPTINVDMVTDAAIILNPYGLTVTVGGEEKTDPFLTETIIITNHSNCPIAVSGSFTPAITGNVKLVANAAAADTGKAEALADKNVFLGVAIGNVTSEDAEIDFTATTGDYRTKVKGAKAVTNFGTWQPKTGTGSYDKTKSGFYPLTAADTAVKFGDADDSQSSKLPYYLGVGDENPTYMGLRVFGLCEKFVNEAWTASDTVSVALAMTLMPNSN